MKSENYSSLISLQNLNRPNKTFRHVKCNKMVYDLEVFINKQFAFQIPLFTVAFIISVKTREITPWRPCLSAEIQQNV